MKKQLLLLLSLSIALWGCSPKSYEYGSNSENSQKSNLTTGVVKTKIVKGSTSQEEVLKLFAMSNIISKNKK